MPNKTLFTPVAPCLWAHITQPQEPIEAGKSREWSITLQLDPQNHQAMDFMVQIDDLFKEINGSAKVARDGLPYKEETDQDGKPTGLIVVKMKRKETSNKGAIIPPPLVLDSKLQPWPKDLRIGNGSRVKCKFSYYGWDAVTGTGRGISLWLEAVQVIEFKEYQGADQAEGFEEVEGGYTLETGAEGFSREEPAATAPAQPEQGMTLAERIKARAAEAQAQAADDDIPF